jgi:hypothetical protein
MQPSSKKAKTQHEHVLTITPFAFQHTASLVDAQLARLGAPNPDFQFALVGVIRLSRCTTSFVCVQFDRIVTKYQLGVCLGELKDVDVTGNDPINEEIQIATCCTRIIIETLDASLRLVHEHWAFTIDDVTRLFMCMFAGIECDSIFHQPLLSPRLSLLRSCLPPWFTQHAHSNTIDHDVLSASHSIDHLWSPDLSVDMLRRLYQPSTAATVAPGLPELSPITLTLLAFSCVRLFVKDACIGRQWHYGLWLQFRSLVMGKSTAFVYPESATVAAIVAQSKIHYQPLEQAFIVRAQELRCLLKRLFVDDKPFNHRCFGFLSAFLEDQMALVDMMAKNWSSISKKNISRQTKHLHHYTRIDRTIGECMIMSSGQGCVHEQFVKSVSHLHDARGPLVYIIVHGVAQWEWLKFVNKFSNPGMRCACANVFDVSVGRYSTVVAIADHDLRLCSIVGHMSFVSYKTRTSPKVLCISYKDKVSHVQFLPMYFEISSCLWTEPSHSGVTLLLAVLRRWISPSGVANDNDYILRTPQLFRALLHKCFRCGVPVAVVAEVTMMMLQPTACSIRSCDAYHTLANSLSELPTPRAGVLQALHKLCMAFDWTSGPMVIPLNLHHRLVHVMCNDDAIQNLTLFMSCIAVSHSKPSVNMPRETAPISDCVHPSIVGVSNPPIPLSTGCSFPLPGGYMQTGISHLNQSAGTTDLLIGTIALVEQSVRQLTYPWTAGASYSHVPFLKVGCRFMGAHDTIPLRTSDHDTDLISDDLLHVVETGAFALSDVMGLMETDGDAPPATVQTSLSKLWARHDRKTKTKTKPRPKSVKPHSREPVSPMRPSPVEPVEPYSPSSPAITSARLPRAQDFSPRFATMQRSVYADTRLSDIERHFELLASTDCASLASRPTNNNAYDY